MADVSAMSGTAHIALPPAKSAATKAVIAPTKNGGTAATLRLDAPEASTPPVPHPAQTPATATVTAGGEGPIGCSPIDEQKEVLALLDHEASQGGALSQEQYVALIRSVLNESLPASIRVRVTEWIASRVCAACPVAVGEAIDALLSLIGSTTGHLQEAAVRSIPTLCKSAPHPAARHSMTRELADVMLQVSGAATGANNSRLREVADNALDEMVTLDMRAVIIKLFHWMNSQTRVEEADEEVRAAERQFACGKLRAILERNGAALTMDGASFDGLMSIFSEGFNRVRTSEDTRALWEALRGMRSFDEREAQKFLSKTMLAFCAAYMYKVGGDPAMTPSSDETAITSASTIPTAVYVSNVVLMEILLAEPSIAKRIDGDIVQRYIQLLLGGSLPDPRSFGDKLRIINVLATLVNGSATLSDATYASMAAIVVPILTQALPPVGAELKDSVPSLTYVEAAFALWAGTLTKGPMGMLTPIEGSEDAGELLKRVKHFKEKLLTEDFVREGRYASGRKILEKSGTVAQAQVRPCLSALQEYVCELAKGRPTLARPQPLSWDVWAEQQHQLQQGPNAAGHTRAQRGNTEGGARNGNAVPGKRGARADDDDGTHPAKRQNRGGGWGGSGGGHGGGFHSRHQGAAHGGSNGHGGSRRGGRR